MLTKEQLADKKYLENHLSEITPGDIDDPIKCEQLLKHSSSIIASYLLNKSELAKVLKSKQDDLELGVDTTIYCDVLRQAMRNVPEKYRSCTLDDIEINDFPEEVIAYILINACRKLSPEEKMKFFINAAKKYPSIVVSGALVSLLETDSMFSKFAKTDNNYLPIFIGNNPFFLPSMRPHNVPLLSELREKALYFVKATKMNLDQLSEKQCDCIKIHLYFSRGGLLRELKELNDELVKFENQKSNKSRIDDKIGGFKEFKNGKPFKHEKLLSGLLGKFAKEKQFATDIYDEKTKSKKAFAKPSDQLSNEQFCQLLQRGELIKDNILGHYTEHNEWIHSIQWWCIDRHRVNNEFFLDTENIVDLYKWIGAEGLKGKDMWGRLLDLVNPFLYLESPTIHFPDDSKINFKNIELGYVNTLGLYMLSEDFAKECPALHHLIVGRIIKRQQGVDFIFVDEIPKNKNLLSGQYGQSNNVFICTKVELYFYDKLQNQSILLTNDEKSLKIIRAEFDKFKKPIAVKSNDFLIPKLSMDHINLILHMIDVPDLKPDENLSKHLSETKLKKVFQLK